MMKMLFLFFFLVKVHDFYLNVYIVYLLNVYKEKSCGELIMSWLINIKKYSYSVVYTFKQYYVI